MRRRRIRQLGAAGVVAWLLLVPAIGAVAQVEEPEDPGAADDEAIDEAEEQEAAALEEGSNLQGYRLQSQASPLGVLLWEPLLPFPVDPGMPHMELQSAYTRATFNTGPNGRALASTLWPGATLGDSMEQLIEDTHYPLKVDARVPQGPEEDSVEYAPGAGMRVKADGTGVEAHSTTTELPSDVLGVGTYESTSRSFLEDGEAVSRARSAVSDVDLFGGVIEIDGIVTDLEARGDGARASTSGATTVSGLTIAGFGYTLDEDGLRPETGEDDSESPLPFGIGVTSPEELREELGIEVELVPHVEEVDESEAQRTAGGVRISIDLEVMRSAFLDDVLDPVADQLPGDVRHPPMPDEVPFNPIDLLFLEPRVDVILARGVVEANTVEALEFDFDLGDDFGDPAPADAFDGGPGEPGAGADLDEAQAAPPSPDAAGAPDDAEAPVDDPEISETPPGEDGVQAMDAASLPGPAGSGLLATLLALTAGALGARGMHGVSGRLFGAGAGCPAGHPTGVPDLKEMDT